MEHITPPVWLFVGSNVKYVHGGCDETPGSLYLLKIPYRV